MNRLVFQKQRQSLLHISAIPQADHDIGKTAIRRGIRMLLMLITHPPHRTERDRVDRGLLVVGAALL